MKQNTPLGIVIAVGNQKGGTGKTTNSVHIAAALGLRGYRCLIVDLDPAAGATRHLGVPENSFAVLVQRELDNPSIVLSDFPPLLGREPLESSVPPAGEFSLGSGTAWGRPFRSVASTSPGTL